MVVKVGELKLKMVLVAGTFVKGITRCAGIRAYSWCTSGNPSTLNSSTHICIYIYICGVYYIQNEVVYLRIRVTAVFTIYSKLLIQFFPILFLVFASQQYNKK